MLRVLKRNISDVVCNVRIGNHVLSQKVWTLRLPVFHQAEMALELTAVNRSSSCKYTHTHTRGVDYLRTFSTNFFLHSFGLGLLSPCEFIILLAGVYPVSQRIHIRLSWSALSPFGCWWSWLGVEFLTRGGTFIYILLPGLQYTSSCWFDLAPSQWNFAMELPESSGPKRLAVTNSPQGPHSESSTNWIVSTSIASEDSCAAMVLTEEHWGLTYTRTGNMIGFIRWSHWHGHEWSKHSLSYEFHYVHYKQGGNRLGDKTG